MIKQAILAIDQGTTSSRAIVFNKLGQVVSSAQKEFEQIYPAEGMVEHNPKDIWRTSLEVSQEAFAKAEENGFQIEAIGITNQRETTIVWNKETGEPIYNAIVWQDRRTSKTCEKMKSEGLLATINSRTGLLLDPYFSATKISWILDNVANARDLAAKNNLAFGTVDSFLLWHLTGGKSHKTDVTNASRTNLFNIHKLEWDFELLKINNIPFQILPEVGDCTFDFGITEKSLFGRSIPILGIAGDQQAASIGQACFEEGAIKSTYGTGCFVLLNTGSKAVSSKNRLLTTIGYKIGDKLSYALEGSIFVSGAAVQWLRDGLGIIKKAEETENLAKSLNDNGGVYLVPAFTGLGTPYWNPEARGAIFGLKRDTSLAHLARAALEAVCYQTRDLLNAMAEDGVNPKKIRVDGGMVANNWLLQFLSDVLNIPVNRPVVTETTALGAAYLAGLKCGYFSSLEDIANNWHLDKEFNPNMTPEQRKVLLAKWDSAVAGVLEHI